MPPDVAAALEVLTMLAAFMVGIGVLVFLLPVGSCSECAHCRNERVSKVRAAPMAFCPLCRVQHAPGEGRHDKDEDKPE